MNGRLTSNLRSRGVRGKKQPPARTSLPPYPTLPSTLLLTIRARVPYPAGRGSADPYATLTCRTCTRVNGISSSFFFFTPPTTPVWPSHLNTFTPPPSPECSSSAVFVFLFVIHSRVFFHIFPPNCTQIRSGHRRNDDAISITTCKSPFPRTNYN